MTPHEDDELRARFRELHDDDRAHVPPFRSLWDPAVARARMPRRALTLGVTWGAVAASVVLALGIAFRGDLVRLVSDAAPHDADDVTPISAWTSPTASLLNAPGRDLLAPPSILSSTLDGLIRTSLPRKGD